MSMLITAPNITATSAQGQAEQIRRYLYQLAEQLNFALSDISGSQQSGLVNTAAGTVTQNGGEQKDPRTSFNEIKSLIIKSADIINAYYEEFSTRFEGEYVAQSDFGDYVQQVALDIQSNAESIEQMYENMQAILTEVEGLSAALIAVNAHINSGLLYYDDEGVPVYGIEVGQRTEVDGVEVFNKYARFTSEKLSFYDKNDNEVAYISDRKLYITHVEVTQTFQQGRFIDRVLSDGSIVTKWIE